MKKAIIIALAVLLLFMAAAQVSADGIVPCGGPGEKACDLCFLFSMLKKIVDFVLLGLIPPIAVLIFLVGGFNIMANGGNVETVTKTKSVLLSTTIGLLIVFGGWVVVNTFLAAMGATAWEAKNGKWWEFSLTCATPEKPVYNGEEQDIEVCPENENSAAD